MWMSIVIIRVDRGNEKKVDLNLKLEFAHWAELSGAESWVKWEKNHMHILCKEDWRLKESEDRGENIKCSSFFILHMGVWAYGKVNESKHFIPFMNEMIFHMMASLNMCELWSGQNSQFRIQSFTHNSQRFLFFSSKSSNPLLLSSLY